MPDILHRCIARSAVISVLVIWYNLPRSDLWRYQDVCFWAHKWAVSKYVGTVGFCLWTTLNPYEFLQLLCICKKFPWLESWLRCKMPGMSSWQFMFSRRPLESSGLDCQDDDHPSSWKRSCEGPAQWKRYAEMLIILIINISKSYQYLCGADILHVPTFPMPSQVAQILWK